MPVTLLLVSEALAVVPVPLPVTAADVPPLRSEASLVVLLSSAEDEEWRIICSELVECSGSASDGL